MASQLAACSGWQELPTEHLLVARGGKNTAWVISCPPPVTFKLLKAPLPSGGGNSQMLSQLLTDVQKPDPQPVLHPECQQRYDADLKAPNVQWSIP